MSYVEKFNTLSQYFENEEVFITSGKKAKFYKIPFVSESDFDTNLPTAKKDDNYDLLLNYFLTNNQYSQKYIFRYLSAPDSSFKENKNFNYYILKKDDGIKADSVVILLHGLNERSWYKYLPWAEHIYETTGKAVVMFPLAFHMDRAPVEWAQSRIMNKVSIERAKLIPGLEKTSFANAALSTRLQFAPERLLLSGVQTYRDIVALIDEIQAGTHPYIKENAGIDMFGYSIGAFLGEILLISNPKEYLTNTRLCMFCGGASLDKSTPASKAIVDSMAIDAVMRYYTKENFESGGTENVAGLIKSFDDVAIYFKSLINSKYHPSLTHSLLTSVQERISVTGLKKDFVFTEKSLRDTFCGKLRNVLKIEDFGFNYTHEKPFPEKIQTEVEVTEGFEKIFEGMSGFLK